MANRTSRVSSQLRERARGLPQQATRVWEQARALATDARWRAARLIAPRSSAQDPNVDLDGMTKDELMELARKEQVSGRSSMTKAQLAAALRRPDKS